MRTKSLFLSGKVVEQIHEYLHDRIMPADYRQHCHYAIENQYQKCCKRCGIPADRHAALDLHDALHAQMEFQEEGERLDRIARKKAKAKQLAAPAAKQLAAKGSEKVN